MHTLKKAYLEITNVCNLNCAFCPGTRREKGFLSPEQFQVLAGRLRPHTEYLYLHLMGEPLLHPQLDELLRRAAQLDFQVIITTNGTLLPQVGGLLCASGAVRKVSVSLHSFEGNEGGGSLSDYLEQCALFARMAAAAGKRCALRLWNLDGETTEGANTQNASILSRLAAFFPPPWKEGWQGVTLAERIYLEWGEKFEWPDPSAAERRETGFCYGLRDQIGVLCDGTVVPCCLDHDGDIPLGNLYEQTLAAILDAPRSRAIYDGFSHGRPTEDLCRRCGYISRFDRSSASR
ncbi:MAG: radical SAM/SPASM domain-containing protein [Clostridia bacterium]|nr:radical SAM/SPASM domain-containing protein [Clostridia bacterium]